MSDMSRRLCDIYVSEIWVDLAGLGHKFWLLPSSFNKSVANLTYVVHYMSVAFPCILNILPLPQPVWDLYYLCFFFFITWLQILPTHVRQKNTWVSVQSFLCSWDRCKGRTQVPCRLESLLGLAPVLRALGTVCKVRAWDRGHQVVVLSQLGSTFPSMLMVVFLYWRLESLYNLRYLPDNIGVLPAFSVWDWRPGLMQQHGLQLTNDRLWLRKTSEEAEAVAALFTLSLLLPSWLCFFFRVYPDDFVVGPWSIDHKVCSFSHLIGHGGVKTKG